MPAKLRSYDGKHVVIRPLAYVAEADLAAYAELKAFPIIPCNLCGSQEHLKRKRVKRLIDELQKEIPHIRQSMLAAVGNVVNTHLLDHNLFDFKSLSEAVGDVAAELDLAVSDYEEETASPALVSIAR
jgi:tRNA 2-thiocytidine biosynthesis protein TtcA